MVHALLEIGVLALLVRPDARAGHDHGADAARLGVVVDLAADLTHERRLRLRRMAPEAAWLEHEVDLVAQHPVDVLVLHGQELLLILLRLLHLALLGGGLQLVVGVPPRHGPRRADLADLEVGPVRDVGGAHDEFPAHLDDHVAEGNGRIQRALGIAPRQEDEIASALLDEPDHVAFLPRFLGGDRQAVGPDHLARRQHVGTEQDNGHPLAGDGPARSGQPVQRNGPQRRNPAADLGRSDVELLMTAHRDDPGPADGDVLLERRHLIRARDHGVQRSG